MLIKLTDETSSDIAALHLLTHLSLPIRHQAIIWTIAGLLSIGPLWTNCSETFIKIQDFSFTKMHLEIWSAKWRPFCPGGDELTLWLVGDVNEILGR